MTLVLNSVWGDGQSATPFPLPPENVRDALRRLVWHYCPAGEPEGCGVAANGLCADYKLVLNKVQTKTTGADKAFWSTFLIRPTKGGYKFGICIKDNSRGWKKKMEAILTDNLQVNKKS